MLLYRCGMTAAFAAGLTRSSLLGALRGHRTYATTGSRILLDFSVSAVPMGHEGRVPKVTCRATVHAVGPLARIEIVRDGSVAHAEDTGAMDAQLAWDDPDTGASKCSYNVHVV